MKQKDEFIGRDIEIVQSNNKQIVGLKGKIVDETKNSFKLQIDKKIKIILKKGSTFDVEGNEFEGAMLLKRPEDRIKSKN